MHIEKSQLRCSNFTCWIKINRNEFFLINPCYDAIAIVDREIVDLINQLDEPKQLSECAIYALKELHDMNFLTTKSRDEEVEFIKKLPQNAHKIISVPKHTIIVTYNCNSRCIYCYQRGLRRRKRWLERILTEEQVDSIYNIIETADAPFIKQQRLRSISLYGGEPLMQENINIVEYILKKGKNLGYTFHTNTNGVNLQDYIDLFKKYTINIGVTIDGPKGIHDQRRSKKDGSGSFDDIVNGIKSALQVGLFVSVRVNVDWGNIKHLPQLADFISDLEWDRLDNINFNLCRTRAKYGVFYPYVMSWNELIREVIRLSKAYPKMRVFGWEWADPRINYLPRILQNRTINVLNSVYCEAHTTALCYDPHGDLYTCAWVVGEKKHSVGSYFPSLKLNENFKIWRSRLVYNLPRCKRCRYALLCGGGCAVEAYQKWGTIMRGFCDKFKAVAELQVPYMVESQPELVQK